MLINSVGMLRILFIFVVSEVFSWFVLKLICGLLVLGGYGVGVWLRGYFV